MCLSFTNNFFWECSKSMAKCIIQYNKCNYNYMIIRVINKDNDFTTVNDKDRILMLVNLMIFYTLKI